MSGVKRSKNHQQESVIALPRQEDERHVIDKMEDIDHLIYSGDIYLGQTVHTVSPPVTRFLLDLTTRTMKYEEEVSYPAGLAKLFDEGLVNAADNTRRGNTTDIKVELQQKNSTIHITNNGTIFDIVKMSYESRANPAEKAYQPELAFFHPRTSSAYRKTKRTTGGKFGLGAKLMFIFSSWGKVTMSDGKLYYEQEVRDHMKVVLPPKVKPAPKKYQDKPFLTISFRPDLNLFYPKGAAPTELSDTIIRVFMTRIFDVAGTTDRKVKVSFKLNEQEKWEKVPVSTFKDYVKLFLPEADRKDLEDAKGNLIGYFECDRWQVALFRNPYDFPVSVSFVNNINTYNGGEHVKYLMGQVTDYCREQTDPKLDLRRIHQNVMLWVNAIIVDPSFPSQCKESLTTHVNQFGSTCILEKRCLNVLKRNGVIDALKSSMEDKLMTKIRKEIGAGRTKSVHDIPHLRDAKFAGTRQRSKCTLYLVEGVSALELAVVGLTLLGSDYNGAMPLKGKVINTDGKSLEKIHKNAEFVNICRVLGLEVGKATPRSELRYGRIVLIMDQDLDGDHIKALFTYLFCKFWPHLLEEEGFLSIMLTPIVVATHKINKKELKRFYTQQNFESWWLALTEAQQKKYKVKYYKGLATSTSKEGKYYFKNAHLHVKPFRRAQIEDLQVMDMIMGKTKGKSDYRKDWLKTYNRNVYIPYENISNLSYAEFFDKQLIHYSWYSVVRGIPLCEDGLTPASRKCIYTMLKKNITTETKVDAVQTQVALTTNYHHGANSLGETTVRLAQTFTGKQNINVFFPAGQFGRRDDGGATHGSTRYLNTYLQSITPLIFPLVDLNILPPMKDEGHETEPFRLSPIIPMILVNGSQNIGTAYRSSIACYQPEELIQHIRQKLNGEEVKYDFHPWYHKFKGVIKNHSTKKGKFTSYGVVEPVSDRTYAITELPIKVATDKYKEKLLELVNKNLIKVPVERHTVEDVHFEVTFVDHVPIPDDLMAFFGLAETFTPIRNLLIESGHEDMTMAHFNDVGEIFEHHFDVRYRDYVKRKTFLIQEHEAKLPYLQARMAFIRGILQKQIVLGIKRDLMHQQMQALGIAEKYFAQLLKISLDRFTEETIAQMAAELEQTQQTLDYYREVSISTLWQKDLDALEAALPAFWQSRYSYEDEEDENE